METDYFAFFGIEPRLDLDLADLEDRYYRLSRQLHPDRYLRATPAERQRALEASAILNDAYRTLRDPVARGEYLVARLGASGQADPALLDEIFELNLEVEEDSQAAGRKLAALREEAAVRLGPAFRAYDEAPGKDTLARVRAALDRVKYLAKMG